MKFDTRPSRPSQNVQQQAPLSFTAQQRNIGNLLGIRVLDSQNDLRQIREAQDVAKKLGIRSLDSQNDVRQIREYLANGAPPLPPVGPAGPTVKPPDGHDLELTVKPTDGHDLPQNQESEPFDFNSALSDLSADFAAQISANESEYAQSMQALEERLQQLQNRPSANPNERNRVMGVRFAGQHNRLRRAGNIFKRDGGRIKGIRSNAINI